MNSEDFRRDFLRTKQTLSMTEAFATSGNHHGYDIGLDRSGYSGHVDENVQKSRNLAAPHQTQLPVVLVKSETKKRHEPLHLQNWSIPPYPTPSFSPRPPQQKDNTGALKLWLLQHKKNPYPTKPEKIMLAILSKMTLTQVSTWFANARRRLKKEYPDDEHVLAEDYGYRKRVQRYASDGYFDRL